MSRRMWRSAPDENLSPTEAHVVCVLTHDTVLKPEQRQAARERLLMQAAVQPILPPFTAPQRRASWLRRQIASLWSVLSYPMLDHGVYERVRVPVGMTHHFNFDRYYTYKLINLPV